MSVEVLSFGDRCLPVQQDARKSEKGKKERAGWVSTAHPVFGLLIWEEACLPGRVPKGFSVLKVLWPYVPKRSFLTIPWFFAASHVPGRLDLILAHVFVALRTQPDMFRGSSVFIPKSSGFRAELKLAERKKRGGGEMWDADGSQMQPVPVIGEPYQTFSDLQLSAKSPTCMPIPATIWLFLVSLTNTVAVFGNSSFLNGGLGSLSVEYHRTVAKHVATGSLHKGTDQAPAVVTDKFLWYAFGGKAVGLCW